MRHRVSHTRMFICPGGRRAAAASLLVSTIAAIGPDSAFAGLGGGGGAHSWTGNVNTSWHNSGNWNTGQVPLAGDSAIVLGGANNVVLFNDTAAIHSLFVGGARTVSNNGHVLNVTSGAATTTVTGLDSSLFITPTVAPFGLATDLLSIQSNADLDMAGGWVLATQVELETGGRIIGHGYIDIDSASPSAFNGLDGSAVTVSGGDLRIRIFNGGSISMPDTINILQPENDLGLVGDMLAPVQDVNIGSDTGLSVQDSWTLAGELIATTAAGQQSYVTGPGSMFVTGDLTVGMNSHLRLDSDARFENTSTVLIGANGTLEINDWYDADAGSVVTIALGGRLRVDGPALAGGWQGDISSSAGVIEVNNGSNFNVSGTLGLGSLFNLRTTIAGTATLRAHGAVNAPGLGAVVQGTFDLRPTATMTLGANAQIITDGTLLLRAGSDTVGDGVLKVNSAGTLAIEEGALVNADVINDGSLKAGAFSQAQYVHIHGSLAQGATGRLYVDLAGTANTDHDIYETDLAASLAGEVVVDLVGGFEPTVGDTFQIIWANGGVNGAFSAVTGEPGFSVSTAGNIVTLTYEGVDSCPADIDGDGVIDVNDLLAVITNWGACGGCAADVDQSGVVDVTDLLMVINEWGSCS